MANGGRTRLAPLVTGLVKNHNIQHVGRNRNKEPIFSTTLATTNIHPRETVNSTYTRMAARRRTCSKKTDVEAITGTTATKLIHHLKCKTNEKIFNVNSIIRHTSTKAIEALMKLVPLKSCWS